MIKELDTKQAFVMILPHAFNMLCAMNKTRNLVIRVDNLQLFTDAGDAVHPEYHQYCFAAQYQKRGNHYEFMISLDAGDWMSAWSDDGKEALKAIFTAANFV